MSRATFVTFIGIFNAIVYFIVVLTSAFGLLAAVDLTKKAERYFVTASLENDFSESDELLEKETAQNLEALGYVALVSGIFFFIYLCVLITSVLMVVGVRKQRHQLMAPWIYVSVIALLIEVYQVVEYLEKDKSEFIWYAFGAVVEATLWYPIYKHYYALKHPHVVQAVAAAAATASPMAVYVPSVQSRPPLEEFNHATAKYVPTTVMVAAPQQQGQIVYPTVPAASNYFTYKV